MRHSSTTPTSTANQPASLSSRIRTRGGLLATGLIAGALLGGGGMAIAATSHSEIHGCVNKKTHALTIQNKCKHGTKSLVWNKLGQQGPRGATGKTGARGAIGATGATGPAGGSNVTVDYAQISAGGFLTGAPNQGMFGFVHDSTGVYQVSASGCVTNNVGVQVTPDNEPGIDNDGLYQASAFGAMDANHDATVKIYITQTAAMQGNPAQLTTLANPVPYDGAVNVTVTC